MTIESRKQPQPIQLVAILAVLAVIVVVGGSWSDRADRAAGPELPVFDYAAAIGREDLEGALDQLAPPLRDSAASFVAWELGNRYTILESAVRTDSLIDRFLGKVNRQPMVVVIMEIETVGQAPWRATEELPVQQIDGHWYLLKVPLLSTKDLPDAPVSPLAAARPRFQQLPRS